MTTIRGRTILADLRRELARRGSARRARELRAYTKSSLPFHGVTTAELRTICRDLIARYPIGSALEWRRAIAAIWAGATHREERHAAIELAGARPYRRFETPAVLPLYQRLIRSGAWWDYVDALAKRVASLLARYPEQLTPTLRRWSRDDDLWIRRAAIIAQVGFRQYTDRALLFDVIQPSIASRDAFLRKAIGWALREYAKAEPDEVGRFLDRHRGRLSPLSMREAEKGFDHVRRHGIRHRSRRPE